VVGAPRRVRHAHRRYQCGIIQVNTSACSNEIRPTASSAMLPAENGPLQGLGQVQPERRECAVACGWVPSRCP
jgi:hypothetical protein